MNLLETLAIEAQTAEAISQEEQEEQIRLENGWQWAPKSWVAKRRLERDTGFD